MVKMVYRKVKRQKDWTTRSATQLEQKKMKS